MALANLARGRFDRRRSGAAAAPLPKSSTRDGRCALMVDGAPFLMLGAQVNNSSALARHAAEGLAGREEAAGEHGERAHRLGADRARSKASSISRSSIRCCARRARNDVRLVLLWFATWKNNGPNYAPEWVKLDNARFPRLVDAEGQGAQFAVAAFGGDARRRPRAFVALMRHLQETSTPQRTVIMVQVQNEPGTYGSVRDFGAAAQKLFEAPVPAALMAQLAAKRGHAGRRCSARMPTSSSTRGRSRSSSARSPRPARRNTRCRCT